ncbi:MAG: DUF4838 domain-containing protein, partial [Armatimonadota bacterium]|nr:DUF4838 domain-containing protein [Armatimonadota bacterium]
MPNHFLTGRFRVALGPFLWCLFLPAISGVSARADFLIAQSGQPRCVILRQAGASAPEVHAADDLAATLKQITGAQFTVRAMPPGERLPARQSAIIVGAGPLTKAFLPDSARLGPEELIMRTHGRYLALAGGRPRGTVYAVTRFLQEQCGVRWWTPWASRIPHRPTLRLTALNVRETPAFEYREPYWFSAMDGAWAVHNQNNGQFAHVSPEMGGKTTYTGFVHTFYSLVPPEKYFKIHPEWYSLINGKRTYQGAQLCLTNPQLKDFVVARVKELLRESPGTNIISVSQNDQFGACECPVCKALDDREGSHSGTMLSFVNYIAQKIA